MFEGTLLPRTLDVPGIGRMRRSWWLDSAGKWVGTIAGPDGPVALRLPGNAKVPAPDAVAAAHGALAADLGTARDALEVAFIESEQGDRPSGAVRWIGLDIWPYGHGKGGAMATFAVPWDEEHAWGVWLDGTGRVIEVVVSPG
jgi:hypothetical protein